MKREDFTGRDFLTLMDFSHEEVDFLLQTAMDLKLKLKNHETHQVLQGLTAMMIFEKVSTRTRVSFQAGCSHLGLQSIFAMSDVLQMKRGEPIKDTARVIDRYCDVLFIRTFEQEKVEEFAQYMDNPVINALTDLTHPCQALADMQTIIEHKGKLEGIKLAYAGDVYNVCHSLMISGSLMGMEIWVARPSGYEPAEKVMEFIKKQPGVGNVHVTDSLEEAVTDADVVYANTWHSMGTKNLEQRIKDFSPFQINAKSMSMAKPDAIFMHCLPGYRGEDMTDEVIEGPQSVVFDQAENRMHTEKALLYLLLKK
jgi:ornithine carbamoyltransferase